VTVPAGETWEVRALRFCNAEAGSRKTEFFLDDQDATRHLTFGTQSSGVLPASIPTTRSWHWIGSLWVPVVEHELRRTIHDGDAQADTVERLSREAALAEHAYRLAKAKAMLTAQGAAPVREAAAMASCAEQHSAHLVAHAALAAARSKLAWQRERAAAVRTLEVSVRQALT